MSYRFDPKARRRSLSTYLFFAMVFGLPILFLILSKYTSVTLRGTFELLTNNWFNSLTIMLAVASIIISYYLYYKSQRVKLPCLALRANYFIGTEELFPDVRFVREIYYKNEKVENVKTSKIAFWNGGKDLIRKKDIVRPIRIKSKDGFQILSFQVKYISEESANITVVLEDGVIKIDFDYLDFGDGVVIVVLHTGKDENDFIIEGKIIGSKEIVFPDTSSPPSDFLTDSDYYYHDYV